MRKFEGLKTDLIAHLIAHVVTDADANADLWSKSAVRCGIYSDSRISDGCLVLLATYTVIFLV